MKRVLRRKGDTTIYFGSEDGKHYRGHYQPHEPLKKHIERNHQIVNEAPASGNRNGWRYAGSVPMTVLWEWLQKTKTPMDVWARNEGGAKDKFIAWLKAEYPALFPKAGAQARPQIAVPTTYTVRPQGDG